MYAAGGCGSGILREREERESEFVHTNENRKSKILEEREKRGRTSYFLIILYFNYLRMTTYNGYSLYCDFGKEVSRNNPTHPTCCSKLCEHEIECFDCLAHPRQLKRLSLSCKVGSSEEWGVLC